MKIVKCNSDYDMARFNWHLLNWCNYQCSYCFVGDALTTDFSDRKQTCQEHKFIIARLKTVDFPFELCLTGGEPTLHPEFFEILNELCSIDNLQRVWMFTNLSRSLSFLTQIKEFAPKVVVYGSWHPEFSKDDFLSKAIDLDCEVHVSLINKQEYWNKTVQLINQLKNNNITYRLNVLQPTQTFVPQYLKDFEDTFLPHLDDAVDTFGITVTYDDGSIERHTEHSLQIKELNYFKGYTCTPKSFQIDLDGNIKNICTGKVMTLQLSQQKIIEEVKCPVDECLEGLLMYPKKLEGKV